MGSHKQCIYSTIPTRNATVSATMAHPFVAVEGRNKHERLSFCVQLRTWIPTAVISVDRSYHHRGGAKVRR